MTRVLHTGDTHLGYRQYQSPERQRDFLAAFRRVIDDAVEEGVDAVVHAGDLFHDRNPSLADIRGTIDALGDLRAADIPFLAVVGNHERMRGEQWIDLFASLGLATRLGRDPTRIGDVDFYGLDFVPRSKRADLEYAFPASDADFAALVSHGPFSPFVPEIRNDAWDLETLLEASTVSFDAVLLGDEHAADTRRIGGVWVTYCGSTERTSAAEREERGYNIVSFDDGVSIARRGIETRPFVQLELDLDDDEDIERVHERIREEPVEDAVVIVSIDGDGGEVPPARVEEFARDRGALIARVTDRRERGGAGDLPEVRFVDPDEAVRERLREMGLSEAARSVDVLVRDETVAKSNLRDRVSGAVADLLDAEPGAFTPADDDDAADQPTEDGPDGPTDDRDQAVVTADEPTDAAEAGAGAEEPAPRSRTTTMEEFL